MVLEKFKHDLSAVKDPRDGCRIFFGRYIKAIPGSADIYIICCDGSYQQFASIKHIVRDCSILIMHIN